MSHTACVPLLQAAGRRVSLKKGHSFGRLFGSGFVATWVLFGGIFPGLFAAGGPKRGVPG